MIAGDGEFLGVDLFGNGEGEVIPFLIATLFVRGDGIMNLSFYAMVLQILLQTIAVLTKNREDMPNAVAIMAFGDADEWIVYLINI